MDESLTFDTQSLNAIEKKDLAKSFDTMSLDPRIYMSMPSLERLDLPEDKSNAQQPKFNQKIISISQVDNESKEQNDLSWTSTYRENVYKHIADTSESIEKTANNDFSSQFTQKNEDNQDVSPATPLKSQIISESELQYAPNTYAPHVFGDEYIINRPPIQLVPLFTVTQIPNNDDGNMYYKDAYGSDASKNSRFPDNTQSPADRVVIDSNPRYSSNTVLRNQAHAPLISENEFKGKTRSAQQQVPSLALRRPESTKPPNIHKQSTKDPQTLESSTTLYESASCEDILLEHSNSYKELGLNNLLLDSLKSESQNAHQVSGMNLCTKIFRIINFLRAIAISIYVFVIASRQMQNIDVIALGAQNLLITSIFFAAIDLIVAFVRLFPQYFWCFWDVKTWDPYKKTFTVWAIIANHDLLIDVIPVLLNVIVRIYLYRMSEILANPSIQSSIYNLSIEITQLNDVFKYQNLIILMCFVATVVYTIAFHAASVMFYLSWDKRATILGLLVFLKSLLLLFDIITNGMLLYKVLVFKGIEIFNLYLLIGLTISVVAPSPLVTLMTNGILNIPLHFFNFRMRLGTRSTGFFRILRASCKQTFHVVLIPIFLYLFYASATLLYILKEIRVIDTAVENLLPQSTFFGWTTGKDVLLGMIWTNVVLNYLGGMVLCVLWVLWSIFSKLYQCRTAHD